MSGSKLLLDTNIALYLIQGDPTIVDVLNGKQIYLSFISELELLSFKNLHPEEKNLIEELISNAFILDINPGIKRYTIDLRRSYSLKLPDSIICGTSLFYDIPLISADKVLKKVEPLEFIFYEK